MKIYLTASGPVPTGNSGPLLLTSDVHDPVTQDVLYRRDNILYSKDISRLFLEHSIDYVEAKCLIDHSDR